MKNLPERIYLNIGDEVPVDVDFRELSEVTWSEEKMSDNDIAFTRKPQWISVEEELPEPDTMCLVFGYQDLDFNGRLSLYTMMAWYDGEDFMDVVKESMAHGESIFLRGFSTFSLKKRTAKTARNINQGATLHIMLNALMGMFVDSRLIYLYIKYLMLSLHIISLIEIQQYPL